MFLDIQVMVNSAVPDQTNSGSSMFAISYTVWGYTPLLMENIDNNV